MSIEFEKDFASKVELTTCIQNKNLLTRGFKSEETTKNGRTYVVLGKDESKFITAFKIALYAVLSIFSTTYKDLYAESKAVWNDKKNVYKFNCPEEKKIVPGVDPKNQPTTKTDPLDPNKAALKKEEEFDAHFRKQEAQYKKAKEVAALRTKLEQNYVNLQKQVTELEKQAVEKLYNEFNTNNSNIEIPLAAVAGLKANALNLNAAVMTAFAIDSSKVTQPHTKRSRKEFFAGGTEKPLVLSKSEFVPNSMVEHLMRDKRDKAIGSKYRQCSSITNMEGAMHSFLTPVASVEISGDYAWKGRHALQNVDGVRNIVLSAAIHPDFEKGGKDEVVMKLVEVKEHALIGKVLPDNFQPLVDTTKDQKEFDAGLEEYEAALQQHMIYHLTTDHRLPALDEAQEGIASIDNVLELLDSLIEAADFDPDDLQRLFVKLNGHVISVEALYNVYHHQIRNEFSALEALLPQGYVYTIDPPSIFAAQLGGAANVSILNRLQALALKHVHAKTPLNNLRMIGFNNFADPKAVELLNHIFPGMAAPKALLFQDDLNYSVKEGYALVLHNNSDAFGQNIETEGPTSMDGVLGCYSDAALQLKRDRFDLAFNII